jgi:Fe-S cluster biogenesis protein NfuA
MAAGHDARAAGERVEALLAELRSHAGPQVAQTAEELVGCLVELYGAGLAAIVSILGEDASGPQLLAALAADPLVESLLLLHDLHPVDADTRIRRAMGQVPARAEYLGIDDDGVARLRLERSGCGSSAAAVQAALEDAVMAAAPELAGVDVEVAAAPKELPLLQITRRSFGPAAAGGRSAAAGGSR